MTIQNGTGCATSTDDKLAICGVGPALVRRRVVQCPTERRRRRMVQVYGGLYYSDHLICLGCGDQWSDGERGERPFARGWREKASRHALTLWLDAVTGAEYRRRVQAEFESWTVTR